MDTLFGMLLLVCTLLYSIRVFYYVVVLFSKKEKEELKKLDIKFSNFAWGGLEHLFYMVSLIGSTILLLS